MHHVAPISFIAPLVGGGYVIEGSGLPSSGAELTRTLGTPTDVDILGLNFLLKKTVNGSQQCLAEAFDGSSQHQLRFDSSDRLEYRIVAGAVKLTTQVFRDPNAWYDISVLYNSTAGTITFWVNGTQITAFDTDSPPSGTDCQLNKSGNTLTLLRDGTNTADTFLGYVARIAVIDGQSGFTATDFGEAVGNGWQINSASGLTFGANGVLIEGGTDMASGHDSSSNFTNTYTSITASSSGLYSGGTSYFTFSGDDIVVTAGDHGIWTTSTLSGDIEVEFTCTGSWSQGQYGFAKSTHTPSDDAQIGLGPDKTKGCAVHHAYSQMYFHDWDNSSNIANTVSPDATSSTNPSGSTVRIQRTSQGIIRVFVDDSLEIEGSDTYTGDVYFWMANHGTITNPLDMDDITINSGGAYGNDFARTGTITATNDSPTDDATNGYGNYAVLNPLSKHASVTLSNANRDWSQTASNQWVEATIGIGSTDTNVYHFQVTAGHPDCQIGVSSGELLPGTTYSTSPNATNMVMAYAGDGNVYYGGGSIASYNTYGATDDIGVSIDRANSQVKFYKNGSLEGTIDISSSASNIDSAAHIVPVMTGGGSATGTVFFIEADMPQSMPSGTVTLCTASLPAPTATTPSAYMQTLTYTGDGSSPRTITGFTDADGNAVTPDFVWLKSRSGAYSHNLYDAVRGAGAEKELQTDGTGAEGASNNAQYGYVSSFESGGFAVTTGSTDDLYVNDSGATYVAWCLKAGGSGSADTSGSISSVVSVADHGGFSIGTFTGTGANATVGHGLTIGAPSFFMIKNLVDATNWTGWHEGMTAGDYAIYLNTNGAEADQGGLAWQSTPPSSSVITLGTQSGQNGSGDGHVFYAFARTPGLIGIGSYTGNGSTDGPYVVVDDGGSGSGSGSGFRPAWVMIKRTDSTGYWDIHDNARNPYNVVDKRLHANAADTEATAGTTAIDFVANGFKIRTGSVANINVSGGTYIYLAFAEYPFGGEGISQARAR